MAAVITIRSSSFCTNSSNLLPNTSENETSLDELFDDNKLPSSVLNGPTPWNFLGSGPSNSLCLLFVITWTTSPVLRPHLLRAHTGLGISSPSIGPIYLMPAVLQKGFRWSSTGLIRDFVDHCIEIGFPISGTLFGDERTDFFAFI